MKEENKCKVCGQELEVFEKGEFHHTIRKVVGICNNCGLLFRKFHGVAWGWIFGKYFEHFVKDEELR